MKILVLNGSPKGNNSNTLKMTNAFLEGMKEDNNYNIDIVNVKSLDINPCTGCFSCWTKTPGSCIFNDDMNDILEKYITADIIIWSFPLYYYSMPSKIKNVMDRMLPTHVPYIGDKEEGGNFHPQRYDLTHQRYILISTCGFWQQENNFDPLVKQFDILYPERLTKVLCSEGELFRVPQLSVRTNEYLEYVKVAGLEYSKTGLISESTNNNLSELLYPGKAFLQMANAHWDINHEHVSKLSSKGKLLDAPIPPTEPTRKFIEQMAGSFNTRVYNNNKSVVVEMYFTDHDTTYQLHLSKEKCNLKVDKKDFVKYTTRIETPLNVWMDISVGKLNGPEAMMQHKYKVVGEFNTMLNMEEWFGISSTPNQTTNKNTTTSNNNLTQNNQNVKKAKKTNMVPLILPFLGLWVALPMDPFISALITIGLCGISLLISVFYKSTVFEKISTFFVIIISILSFLNINTIVLVGLSYLIFGVIWLAGACTKIPLTAYYSCYSHGGEKALDNKLFLKTNRIITTVWGIAYLVAAGLSVLLMFSNFITFTGAILAVFPILLGNFTFIFAKAYPAHVAKK